MLLRAYCNYGIGGRKRNNKHKRDKKVSVQVCVKAYIIRLHGSAFTTLNTNTNTSEIGSLLNKHALLSCYFLRSLQNGPQCHGALFNQPGCATRGSTAVGCHAVKASALSLS